MPTPGKRDNPEKAERAYREFQQLKKQIKLVGNSQKIRMEQALFCGREWSVEVWMELFIKNPLMQQFAVGLIWGIYKEEKLQQSFRYMEDGSFNTAKEEVFRLPIGEKEKRIQLVHPLEFEEEERAAWKEQLSDYEVIQPIEQIERAVFRKEEAELEQENLERFAGFCMGNTQLGRKILSLGWERGTVWDAGMIYNYYREDLEVGWGVELYFSGGYVGGWDIEEEVTLYDAQFYRIGEEVEKKDAYYGKVEEGKGALLSEVPKQYFSEVVKQLSLVTLSCEKRVENWREERSY